MKCKLCKEEIPNNHVQQGELHIGCNEKEIDLWRITLLGTPNKGGYYEIDVYQVLDQIKDMDDYSSYVITKTKMKAGEYFSLPEFQGF